MSATHRSSKHETRWVVGASCSGITISTMGAFAIIIATVRRYGSVCDPVSCMPAGMSDTEFKLAAIMAVIMWASLLRLIMFLVSRLRKI